MPCLCVALILFVRRSLFFCQFSKTWSMENGLKNFKCLKCGIFSPEVKSKKYDHPSPVNYPSIKNCINFSFILSMLRLCIVPGLCILSIARQLKTMPKTGYVSSSALLYKCVALPGYGLRDKACLVSTRR